MRPLPTLDPLPASPSVFELPADDWQSFFADQTSTLDSLVSELTGSENTQASNAAAIGSSLDALDSSFNTLVEIFDELAAADQAVDLTTEIADAATLDQNLVSNLDSWAPDIASMASVILDEISALLNYAINYIENVVAEEFQNLESWIESILSWIGQI